MSPMSKPAFFRMHWLLLVILALISACTPSSRMPALGGASEPFDGLWTAAFMLEMNTGSAQTSTPWFTFILDLQQEGEDVIGTIRAEGVDVTGVVRGTVDKAGVLHGTMRLSSNDHDWESLTLSLLPDRVLGTGTAIFKAAPNEIHLYSINLLPVTSIPLEDPAIIQDAIQRPTQSTDGSQKVPIRWLLDGGSVWRPEQSWLNAFNASQDEIELSLMFIHGDLLVVDTMFRNRDKGIEDTLPDIAPFSQWEEYGMRDSWLDLTPYLQEYDLSDFEPAALRQWQDEDGKQFGLPVTAESTVLYYNRDLFDAAGIPYPAARYGEPYADGEPWDIDKLQEIAIQLTLDGNGRNPTQPGFEPLDIVQWGFAPAWLFIDEIAALFGPEPIFDENQNVRLPDSWRDAIRWYYAGMWEKHFIHTAKDLQSGNKFTTAMVLSGPGYVTVCCDKASESPLYWDMAALPSYKGRVSGHPDGLGLGILKTTPHPQEAVRTLYNMVTDPNLLDSYLSGNNRMPALISRRQVFLTEMDSRYPQGLNWQVIVDGFAYQETPGALSPKAFEWRIKPPIWDFKSMLENTEGLDIEAALDDLEIALQNAIHTSE